MSSPALRVLLVGGTGFLGSHVAGALVQAGHHVTTLSRSGRTNHPQEHALAADRGDVACMQHAG